MKFAAINRIKQGTKTDEMHPLRANEAKVVWDLHKRGILESIFYRTDGPGALLILECASKEELQKELNKLPLHKYMDIEIIPLKPYEGYEAIWNE